jgi:hypothetical protein
VFAAQVLRQPLLPHQLAAANSEAFTTVIAASRRTGKTTLIEVLAAWTCMRERNVKAIILSAGQDASRRVTEGIGAMLGNNPLTRGAVINDFSTRIKLANGSEIVSLPASERQIRGYGKGVKLLVVDEAGQVPEELWEAAEPVAMDERRNGGRVILAGTPRGAAQSFFRKAFEEGEAGSPSVSSHHWTNVLSPVVDPVDIEEKRLRMSPAAFACEWLGEWSAAAGSLFPWALLDRQTADIELPSFLSLEPPAMPMVGVDWGVSFDRSAAVAIYRLPVEELNRDSEVKPRFCALPKIWPLATPLSDTWKEIVRVKARFAVLSSETNGVGAGGSQELRRLLGEQRRPPKGWNGVHTTNEIKTAAYGAVLQLLEREQLVLPRDPDLLRQLAGLRFEQGARGFTRIEAEDVAVHDDVSDALALATGPHNTAKARGRVIVELLKFAQPGHLLDARPPGRFAEEEVVETGGGLRVWKRPPLQSITDYELTIPTKEARRP